MSVSTLCRSIIFLLLVCMSIEKILACDNHNRSWESMDDAYATLHSGNGRTYELLIKIARTPDQHQAGFQYVCSELVQKMEHPVCVPAELADTVPYETMYWKILTSRFFRKMVDYWN